MITSFLFVRIGYEVFECIVVSNEKQEIRYDIYNVERHNMSPGCHLINHMNKNWNLVHDYMKKDNFKFNCDCGRCSKGWISIVKILKGEIYDYRLLFCARCKQSKTELAQKYVSEYKYYYYSSLHVPAQYTPIVFFN